MLIGTVIGNVISTKKIDDLRGSKFLCVRINGEKSYDLIAVDSVGAGMGELVLVTTGHNAQYAFQQKEVPVDAVIVGIIDEKH
jgi:ethanolamine utilization protein EutN